MHQEPRRINWNRESFLSILKTFQITWNEHFGNNSTAAYLIKERSPYIRPICLDPYCAGPKEQEPKKSEIGEMLHARVVELHK